VKWGLDHVPCVLYTDGSNSVCFLTKQKQSGKIEDVWRKKKAEKQKGT